MMTMVSVLVVNFNGRDVLGDALDSLAHQTRRPDEVVVVDNASHDGSVACLRDRFPWVTVVASPANVGFAAGNNLAAAHARGDILALLNSDAVADPRWLEELLRPLEADPAVGATVAKVYLAGVQGMIDCAGAEFNNLGFCWGRGSNQSDRGQFNDLAEVPAATACAMAVRRSALGNTSLFDPRLFMYYEEFDLSLRLRGRGFSIRYAPSAVVFHRRSHSVNATAVRPLLFRQFYGNRNRVKILAKYYPWRVLLRSFPLICLSLVYWDSVFLRRGGIGMCLRAIGSQVRYGMEGMWERWRGQGVPASTWLPWMARHGFRDLMALRAALGSHVHVS